MEISEAILLMIVFPAIMGWLIGRNMTTCGVVGITGLLLAILGLGVWSFYEPGVPGQPALQIYLGVFAAPILTAWGVGIGVGRLMRGGRV